VFVEERAQFGQWNHAKNVGVDGLRGDAFKPCGFSVADVASEFQHSGLVDFFSDQKIDELAVGPGGLSDEFGDCFAHG